MMSKLQKAVKDIHIADTGKLKKSEKDRIHPLSRLIVTVFYILVVVSFPKYDLSGLASMVLYLLITGIWGEISIKEAVRHIWPMLLLVSIVGAANPFVEREVCWQIGNFSVTFGMLSMLTLMLKGIFSVVASYFLIMTIGMEGICYALRSLHVPKEFVTVLLLIYRYLIVLLKEVERMMQAYKLRAPGQKGIHFKAWGTFLGQLLMHSMDRAETVYESMLLRGYTGEIVGEKFTGKSWFGILYAVLWILFLTGLRILPVFWLVGSIIW